MALTKISTGGVNDDAIDKAQIENEAVDAPRLHVSNAGSSGQFLQKQAGSTGGLAWATVDTNLSSDTTPQLGGDVDTNDHNIEFKDRNGTDDANVLNFGAGDDMRFYSDGDYGYIQGDELRIGTASNTTNAVFTNTKFDFRQDVDITNSKKLGIGGSYGTSGQVLTSGGSGAAPSWAAVPAGGNTVELVADGAIAAGKPVQIKANGKIEEIKETVVESNIASKINNQGIEDTTTAQNYLAYDPTNRYVLHTWQSNESGVEWSNYRLYTINSTGAALSSSGSDQRLVSTSSSTQPKHVRSGFDTNRGKFLIINGRDKSSSNYKTSYVGTVSGTSVTWSNQTTIDDNTNETDDIKLVYDTTNNMFVALYKIYASGIRCSSGTMNSSGEMTWTNASVVTSDGGNYIDRVNAAYDSTTNRIVLAYRYENPSGGARSGKMKIGRKSTSDNTITWGSEIEWHGHDWDAAGLACANGKVVIVFNDMNDSRKLKYRVGTLSSSDNTVSWGSTTATGLADHCFNVDLCYQSSIDKFLISYTVSPNGTTQQNGDDSKIAKGELSGTSITWSNATTYDNDSNRGLNIIPLGGTVGTSYAGFAHAGNAANDSNRNKFYIQHAATATSNMSRTQVVGFAPSAISDGATGTVNTDGNTIDNQSGLTPGTRYYVQATGALGTSATDSGGSNLEAGGIALSATKLLIRFRSP